jgi:branched-chain amino acid transport system substrate-binding protein
MRFMKGITTLAMVGVVIVMVSGCGTGTSTKAATSSTTIKICTDQPLSGPEGNAGKPAENGVTLAISQANANHTIPGYTLQQVNYDDVGPSGHTDPTTGANNIRTAIGDALTAGCIGAFASPVTAAMLPIANQAPLALISPTSTSPELTKPSFGQTATLRPTGKVTFFRLTATDDQQGPVGADYLFQQLHLQKVYIIDDTEVYGKELSDAFEAEWRKLGGTVLGHIGLDNTTTSFISPLTAAAALHPDLIYYGGTATNGGTLLRQQMELIPGLKGVTFAGGDALLSQDFAMSVGPGGFGTILTVAGVNPFVLPSARPFLQAFMQMFPNPNDLAPYTATAYDATNVLIQAIKQAIANGAKNPTGSSDATGAAAFRQAVINQIAATSYDGVIGHISFDTNGDIVNGVISIYKLDQKGFDFISQVNVQG